MEDKRHATDLHGDAAALQAPLDQFGSGGEGKELAIKTGSKWDMGRVSLCGDSLWVTAEAPSDSALIPLQSLPLGQGSCWCCSRFYSDLHFWTGHGAGPPLACSRLIPGSAGGSVIFAPGGNAFIRVRGPLGKQMGKLRGLVGDASHPGFKLISGLK